MKKLWIITGLVIFLAVGAWGQTEVYQWVGAGYGGDGISWSIASNWEHVGYAPPSPYYPGEIANNDTAIIPLGSGFTVQLDDTVELDSVVIASDASLEIGANICTVTGTFTNAGTLYLDGVSTTQIGTQPTIGGTVVFTNAGTTLAGITSFNNVTIQGGARTAGAALTVTDTLTIDAGSLDLAGNALNVTTSITDNGTIFLDGSQTVTPATIGGTGLVHFNAAGTGLAGITVFPGLRIGAGARTAGAALTVTGALTIDAGASLDLVGNALNVTTSITDNGTIFLTGAQTITVPSATIGGTGLVHFDAGAGPGLAAITTFPGLRIGAGTRTAGAALTVTGTLTIDAGASLNLAGNALNVTTSITDNGTIFLTGAQTITVPSATIGGTGLVHFNAAGTGFAGITTFPSVQISVGGTRTPPATINVSGDFTQSGTALTFGSAVTLNMTGAGGNIAASGITGNVTLSGGTTTNASGAVAITGDFTIAAGKTLNMGGSNLSVTTLTITGTLLAGPQITLNGGTWTRTGTFTHNSGTVTFNTGSTVNSDNTGANAFYNVSCAGTVSFTGSNTINSLTCSAAALSFPTGTTQVQAISGITATGTNSLTRTGAADLWNLTVLNQGNFTSSGLTTISWCNSANYLRLPNNGTTFTNGGTETNLRVFEGGSFTWNGSSSSNWELDANWEAGYYPLVDDVLSVIIIPSPSAYTNRLTLSRAVTYNCRSLDIDSDAEIDLAGYVLAVHAANGLTNAGTIMLHGIAAQVTVNSLATTGSAVGGTIHYYGNASAGWVFGYSYVNLIVASTATMPATGAALTASGNAEFHSPITSNSVSVTGTTIIGANITTSATGTSQSYTGAVTLSAGVNLTGDAGTLIEFGSTVDGAQALTVTDANVRFGGIVGGGTALASINVTTGTTAINTTGIRTTGGQSYGGAVTLGAGVNLTGNAGTLIEFLDTVNGTQALTVTNANVRFDGIVGGGTALTSINVNTGVTTINTTAIRTTTGGQRYGGAVTLDDGVTLTGGTGTLIQFVSIVNGGHTLTVATADVQFGGVVGGTTPLTSVTVTAGTTAINTTAITTATGGQSYGGAVTLGAGVNLTGDAGTWIEFVSTVDGGQALTVTDANVRFGDEVGGTTPLTSVNVTAGASLIEINANITTTSTQTYTGAVTLTASDIVLAGGGTISFSNTLDGDTTDYDLTVIAGSGNITFGNVVGGINHLDTLTLGDNAETGIVNINAEINATLVVFAGGPSQKVQQSGSAAAARLGNVRINNGTTLTLEDSVRQKDGSILTIGQGVSGELNTGYIDSLPSSPGHSWIHGSSVALPSGFTGFYGGNGSLVFNAGSKLVTNDFFTPASTTYDVGLAGESGIDAGGNVTINRTFSGISGGVLTGTPYSSLHDATLTMRGTEKTLLTGAAVHLGNLVVAGGDAGKLPPPPPYVPPPYAPAPPPDAAGTSLGSDIILEGSVTIDNGSVMDSAGRKITLLPRSSRPAGETVDNFWEQIGTGIFIHRNSSNSIVEFGAYSLNSHFYAIRGTTNWWVLACHEPAATIKFSNHPDEHSIYGRIDVKPLLADGVTTDRTQANMIELSRINEKPSNYMPSPDESLIPETDGADWYIPPTVVNPCFWYFNLVAGAQLDMDYVYLHYCWSKNRIPQPSDRAETLIIAIQYVRLDDTLTPTYTLGTPRNDPDLETSFGYSYYNKNWFIADYFFYSFTEDSNGNGKIDRIRAQAGFGLNGYFAGFSVEVAGYDIDTSRGGNGANGAKGYDLVSDVTLNHDDNDSIFIYIKENDFDSSPILKWRITSENHELRDHATGSVKMNNVEVNSVYVDYQTIDTVPPRINYAFTLPDHNEVYFQLSKEAEFDSSVTLGGLGSQSPVALSGLDQGRAPVSGRAAGKEFIITPDSNYSLAELAAGSEYFTLNKVMDNAKLAQDKRSQPVIAGSSETYYAYQYPSPKYPVDWAYSDYIEIRGWYEGPGSPYNKNFMPVTGDPADLPPVKEWYYDEAAPGAVSLPINVADYANTGPQGNRMFGLSNGLTDAAADYAMGQHRVSDLLISIPPQDLSAESQARFFIWPLWARYENRADPGGLLGTLPPGYGYMGQDGSTFTDTTIIWDFGGRRFLEQDDIVLQARLSGALSSGTPSLVSVFNISDNFKSRSGHGSVGLWNPGQPLWNDNPPPPPYTPPPFTGMVPRWYTGPLLPAPVLASSAPLFNYQFSQGDFGSNGVAEFFFLLTGSPPDLLAGRLDIIPGAAIPADWYLKVKPFSFGIHGITRQRSGVTILNNVINSGKRERVYVDYQLNKSGRVTIQVFTLAGNLVKVLENGNKDASREYYRVSWDGTNNGGRPVARGMYFIRVVAPEIDEIRKVMVVR